MIRPVCIASSLAILASLALPGDWNAASTLQAAEPVVRSFEVEDVERIRAVRAHIYIPDGTGASARILVVMHGITRTAQRYLEVWRPVADRYGVVLVAPEFSRQDWPSARHYNRGNIFTKGRSSAKPRALWSFTAMEKAVELTAGVAGLNGDSFFLYGHSAGAQFVHRYVMLTGGKRLIGAVAANAGYYLWPDENQNFPYGIRQLKDHDWDWHAVFRTKLTLLIGGNDNNPNARHLPKRKGAMKQGEHRLARAFNFHGAARAFARSSGYDFQWRLEEVPGVGHSNRGMRDAAARILFGR